MKYLTFGTTNQAKVRQIQGALLPLAITVSALPESARDIVVIEDGETVQANARKKALAYASAIGGPVFSMDNALYLDGLSVERQPGIHVRRIQGTSERPSDEELRVYYSGLIASLGGRVRGRWEFACCYARPDGTYEELTIVSPRVFTAIACERVIPGYPLESIQIDPDSGKYIAEMSQSEQDHFWQSAIGADLATFIGAIEA